LGPDAERLHYSKPFEAAMSSFPDGGCDRMWNVTRRTLDSGLTVIARTFPSRVAALEVFVRMGVLYERDGEVGLSSLVQSLLFRGTSRRDSETIAYEIESSGCRVSSAAGKDFSTVSLLATADNFEFGLGILLDVLKDATFPEDELERERRIAIEAIKSRGDRGLRRAIDLALRMHYGDHPYHRPTAGKIESVAGFGRDDLIGFFRRHYYPGNILVSAAGHFDEGLLLRRLEEELGVLPDPGVPPSPVNSPLPARDGVREAYEERDSGETWMAMIYGAPNIMAPDFIAMEVFDAIFGSALDSRLWNELREKRGLAYDVGTSYSPRVGPSLYLIYVGTDRDKLAAVREAVAGEIERMKDEPVSEEELEAAKAFLRGAFITSMERVSSQATLLGQYEVMGLGYGFAERYCELIGSVSQDDILKLCRKYFGGHYSLGIVAPAR